jgi:hypothetical protein
LIFGEFEPQGYQLCIREVNKGFISLNSLNKEEGSVLLAVVCVNFFFHSYFFQSVCLFYFLGNFFPISPHSKKQKQKQKQKDTKDKYSRFPREKRKD